jgi:hypothetical protein
MATLTPVLGLSKPVVGADDDIWGNMWNQNADILDGLVKPVDLAPYLLKAGGTMTGFLTLSANATNALHAVPLQQMQTGLATKIGDAPNDGAYYARRNLGWEVSPGSAINQDAPSDGFAYGRRNASWDKTLRLVGGVVTGPTTITGTSFTAKGNLMLGVTEPASMAAAGASGGMTIGWVATFNNYASYAYYDTIGNTWRRLDATTAPAVFSPGYNGGFLFQAAAAGAKDSAVTFNTLVTISSGGSIGAWYTPPPGSAALLAGGDIVLRNAVSTNIYYNNILGNWCYWNNGSGHLITMDINVAPALHFMTAPVGTAGTAPVLTTQLTIRADGVIVAPWFSTSSGVTVGGEIYCTSGIHIGTQNGWEWNHYVEGGSGDHIHIQRSGYYLRWVNNGGQWVWVNGGVTGMTLAGGSLTLAGQLNGQGADGNGYGASFQGGVWTHKNVWADEGFGTGSSVTAGYVHSTGDASFDVNSYFNYMRVGGGIMNYNGTMWFADNSAYYMQRSNADGFLRFVDNGTVNLEIRPWGDVYVRNGILVYGGTVECTNGCIGVKYSAGAYSNAHVFLFGWQSLNTGLVTVSVDNGGAAYSIANASDARLKGDIAASRHDCLATVQALAVRQFRWKTVDDTWGLAKARLLPDREPIKRVGLVAQEVHEVFPEGVLEGDDFEDHLGRVWGLDPNNMIALLVGATQQMAARLAKLEGRHK